MPSAHGTNLFTFHAVVVLAATSACGEPTPDMIDPLDSASGGNVSGTSPYEYEGDGADETASPEQYHNGCLRFAEDPVGLPGVRHQCGGIVTARLNFDVVGLGDNNGSRSFATLLEFGNNKPDDSYEKPKVMACCKPIEDQTQPWNGPQLNSCYHDFVENACASTVARILSLKDEEDTPVLAYPQIDELAQWFADHQQDCYKEFWAESGADNFNPAQLPMATLPEPFPSHSWALPSGAETTNVENIQLELETPWITDAWLPAASDDWLECYAQDENNDVSFVVAGPDSGVVAELQEGDATLTGPTVASTGTISGQAELQSLANNCDICSYMSFVPSSETFESMVLDSAEPAALIRDGNTEVTIDRFRIALYSPAATIHQNGNVYVVPADTALFSITADAAGQGWSLTGYNRDSFTIAYSQTKSRWYVGGFTIDYTDHTNETWEIEIDPLTFKE